MQTWKTGRLLLFPGKNYERGFVVLTYVYIQNPIIFIEKKKQFLFFKSQTLRKANNYKTKHTLKK